MELRYAKLIVSLLICTKKTAYHPSGKKKTMKQTNNSQALELKASCPARRPCGPTYATDGKVVVDILAFTLAYLLTAAAKLYNFTEAGKVI